MPRKIEKNAKSKEEALRLAAEEFGVPIEALSYTVEREIGKGLLGKLLGKEVIISAWITKEAEEEERLRRTREERRRMREEKAANAAVKKPEPKTEKKNEPERKPVLKAEPTPVVKTEPTPVSGTEAAAEVQPAAAPKDKKRREVTEKSLKDAEYFVTELVHKMGLSDAAVDVKNSGSSVDVTISGERMGLIIGKRGDTLDAVQYLTSLYVNKEKNSYIKVNIDTEGYRARREKTLIQLAHSLERRVVREGRAITLEPMSPNERRIIHAALQGNDEIRTYSVGEEPNRKVVVSLNEE